MVEQRKDTVIRVMREFVEGLASLPFIPLAVIMPAYRAYYIGLITGEAEWGRRPVLVQRLSLKLFPEKDRADAADLINGALARNGKVGI